MRKLARGVPKSAVVTLVKLDEMLQNLKEKSKYMSITELVEQGALRATIADVFPAPQPATMARLVQADDDGEITLAAAVRRRAAKVAART